MTNSLKDFIESEEVQSCIRNKDMKGLYNLAMAYDVPAGEEKLNIQLNNYMIEIGQHEEYIKELGFVPAHMFDENETLTQVTLAPNVDKIDSWAFFDCNITDIYVESDTLYLGRHVFDRFMENQLTIHTVPGLVITNIKKPNNSVNIFKEHQVEDL